MNLKKKAEKGGIESIVGIMILVGLLILLIVTIVIPMIQDAQDRATGNEEQMGAVDTYVQTTIDEVLKTDTKRQ